MAVRTAISLALLGGLVGSAAAQTPRPLPSNVANDAPPRTIYYQKTTTPLTQPQVRRVDYQDNQEAGTIPLPASVVDVIKRAANETIDPKELFAMKSEAQIDQEIVKESGPTSIYSQFPTNYNRQYQSLNFTGRSFEPRVKYVEPNFVCHRRLYFEEKNAERQGWELGPLQPFVSTGYFLKDFFFLPYHFATRPCDRWECSAGNCQPGDATPYLIYPIEFSVTGALFQAGTVVGLAAIFP
jgi:hypothetical protein